jgi:hypothetical protein
MIDLLSFVGLALTIIGLLITIELFFISNRYFIEGIKENKKK